MHYGWNIFCRLPVNYNAQTRNNNMNAEVFGSPQNIKYIFYFTVMDVTDLKA